MAAAAFKGALLALALGACTSIAADQRTFEGTQWRVTAVNGQSTPAAGNYAIGFEKGRIGGQFGCNHFGGEYRINHDVLSTNAVQMTLMACPEPAMTFEAAGLAVLQQPMRLTWASGGRLTLSNAGGSIALQRAQ